MKKNESAENYLETIYVLSKKLPVVRSVDIATELNFKKPSVSVAMKHLREKELIVVSDAGFITLTEEGHAQAEAIYERHTILTKMFTMLGVSEETATEDACLIEHVLSDESFEAIKKHLKEKSIH
jgi:Mn-dependent DtxR family transcriptional regulator